jgi:transposase
MGSDFMNAVGIDVAKGKSVVAVLRPLGVVVAKPFEVSHTAMDLGKLSNFLKSLDGETRVVMEHTGRYWEPIAQVIHESGLFVSAVNPLLIREYGNNSLRRVKTDKADAKKIARYGLDNWADLRHYTPMDTIRYELKTLNRQFHLFSKNKAAISNNLIALLDQSFPGANAWFDSPARKDGSQKWVDFVMTFWHVDCVCTASLAAFTERYRKWCKRKGYNFSQAKAEEIHSHSKELIALVPKSPTTKLLVQQAASQLLSVSQTVEALRAEMNRLAALLPEYPVVMGMYGVGESLGPQLIAEIGDIRRFEGKRSLVAFAGVDPMPNQSGTRESRSNKSSKRGSPFLRKTLFNVMSALLKLSPPDEPVYQFLDRKRTEGKPYHVYMTAGANKFLRIYYGKVRDHLAALDAPAPDETVANP